MSEVPKPAGPAPDGEPGEAAREETPAPAPGPPRRLMPAAALLVPALLVAALLLAAAAFATAPFWAPLLPWGSGGRDAVRAIAARLDGLERAQRDTAQQLKQQPQRGDLEQLREQQRQAAAEAKTELQRLAQRIEALEARPAAPTADIGDLRQQQSGLAQRLAELSARLDAVENAQKARGSRDDADAALILGLLQMREAVEAGRPFAAEYQAFAALARGRPELGKAAAALAEPAATGVAGPAVLARQLRDLGRTIAAAGAAPMPEEAAGWGEAILARLRGLVRVRRIDGARPQGPEAAVNQAELALAGGDLAAAAAALDKLRGAPAEAAAPWLRMARQRLAVDDALRRVEALLTAGLGSPGGSAAPGSAG